MPVYKDGSKWSVQFYYSDWTGKRKKKHKRGFASKKEARVYEAEFLLKTNADMDMTLASFTEIYFKDKAHELKERSIRNKKYVIFAHILPKLGGKAMSAIRPCDIIDWQNYIIDKGFSQGYMRMLQNQITALFTHAQRIYGLEKNPCKSVRKIGRSDERSLNFWTIDEYKRFIGTYDSDSMHYVMFEILFWTGCREGEMLALTADDIDLKDRKISITKTYHRHGGRDIMTEPKTYDSNRTVEIPAFLVDEISKYIERTGSAECGRRLFPICAEAVQHNMKYHIAKAGVKKIRVHDLRHSHVAYLIYTGIPPLLIKERLGHKDIKITMNTYGHLYPSEQRKVADMLDMVRQKEGRF